MTRPVALALMMLVVAVGVLALTVPGCNQTYQQCDADSDCVIICDCPGGGPSATVIHPCRLGNCGADHYGDLDCVRPCAERNPFAADDDDSAADDDDSAGDDDDSAR